MVAASTETLQDLRRLDADRYLSLLYAPAGKREAIATLYLFNAEIASIRDRIHEPLPGEIRIQWWRDALEAGEGGGHPLAEALIDIVRRYHLPRGVLDSHLEARIFDLYDDSMPSRTDLEGYLGETASVLIQLSALILDAEAAPRFAEAAGHAGCAQGIAGILRLLPLHRARGQCYVPAELLAAAGTNRDAFVGPESEGGVRVVQAMVELGRDHVARFETCARGMPASLRSAFLPAALASAYLDRAARLGERALSVPADISALKRHAVLLRRAMRGW